MYIFLIFHSYPSPYKFFSQAIETINKIENMYIYIYIMKILQIEFLYNTIIIYII